MLTARMKQFPRSLRAALVTASLALATVPALAVTAAPAEAATTGTHYLCSSASVRHSDREHVIGYAQAGDRMVVERYSEFTNSQGGHSEWAVGTVYTEAGALYGYVLYNGSTFCP
jgi:hypothetical protein